MAVSFTRFGIIADIHSNLAALRAVLDALAREEVGTVLCLGDVVGYGPSPHEVIAALGKVTLQGIRGNHDRYALGENSDQIRAATAEAVEYTRRCLTDTDKAFLTAPQDTLLYQDRILLVHGSPRNRDEYILTQESAVLSYRHMRAEYAGVYLCFFGHTHLPMAVGDGRVAQDLDHGCTIGLKFMVPYLLNPGSVGQPRDGNPDAAYAVLDLAERAVTFRRVPYDVADTQNRMRDAGLPRYLADRLAVGK